jgi:hypothetical protein
MAAADRGESLYNAGIDHQHGANEGTPMTREERLVVQAAVLSDRAVLSVQTRYGQAQYRALLARERMERVELAARRRVALRDRIVRTRLCLRTQRQAQR